MDQPVSSAKVTASPFAVIVLVGLVIAFLGADYFYLNTQNAIELTPKHASVLQDCLCYGLLGALGCAALIWWQTSGDGVFRIVLMVLAVVLGFASAFQVSIAVTNVAQMRADFPADKTQTYRAQWPITAAYRFHSRKEGTTYSIDTTTLVTSMNVHRQDFDFMSGNSAPEDIGMKGDQVLSHGRFCANVVLQRAGDAIRLMVGPGRPLPSGSIGLCSPSAAN